MVVDDFNIARAGGPLRPLKTDPPLLVDPDAILSLTVTPQRLQPVSGKAPKRLQMWCRLKAIQPNFSLSAKALEGRNPVAIRKAARLPIPVALDHERYYL